MIFTSRSPRLVERMTLLVRRERHCRDVISTGPLQDSSLNCLVLLHGLLEVVYCLKVAIVEVGVLPSRRREYLDSRQGKG